MSFTLLIHAVKLRNFEEIKSKEDFAFDRTVDDALLTLDLIKATGAGVQAHSKRDKPMMAPITIKEFRGFLESFFSEKADNSFLSIRLSEFRSTASNSPREGIDSVASGEEGLKEKGREDTHPNRIRIADEQKRLIARFLFFTIFT